MSTVISIENLGKKYTLHHQQRESYRALRDVLTNGVASIGQKLLHPFRKASTNRQTQEDFWALKDVSFEVKQGDRIGIIGRNGAGKSTLLKILSRITEPTSGRVKIKGRVASLLEVGTGFHPELTGRENIYLNGAILGMSRVEIKKKFDEIVDFAEIEKFLDTPVKRYSSGMYVRLAFAVAAHLEPEILVVDEVLAVGDAQFQKKCLGKMGEVAQGGRTVLFVSHNMAAISNLCKRAICLSQGTLKISSSTPEVIGYYLTNAPSNNSIKLSNRLDRKGSGIAKFYNAQILDSNKTDTVDVICGQDMTIRIKLCSETERIFNNFSIAIGVDNAYGQRVLHLSNESIGVFFSNFDITTEYIDIKIHKLSLFPGTYSAVLFLSSNNIIDDWIQNALNFNVIDGDFYGTGKLPPYGQGVFLANYSINPWKNHA
jgi:lipopolysaccharide transport system ATP-binding protein